MYFLFILIFWRGGGEFWSFGWQVFLCQLFLVPGPGGLGILLVLGSKSFVYVSKSFGCWGSDGGSGAGEAPNAQPESLNPQNPQALHLYPKTLNPKP